jgi:hypothetical protein
MPELVHPTEEKACQLRASGKTQLAAYFEAFEVPHDSKANNSSRFFRRADVRARVNEIKRRRAVLADLDDAWVLRQLKAIAKNGELIGDSNLDDYFTHTEDGRRIGIDLTDVPRAKMAGLEEVTVEQYMEGSRDDPETIKRTKIKLRSAASTIQAAELIGKWLGMWPNKMALTDEKGEGPAILEVRWKRHEPEQSAA